tara:strand:+ start:179 stop:910 length:732 start_codon:yes stop_codon:yes gene_type:complete
MGIFFDFTYSLNLLGNELIWFLFLLFCFSSILIFLKLFGYVGLYVYTVVAVIAGNIQVLKIVDFFYFIEPVALGTILFASTYLCTDILSEYYTKEKAQKNILLGFSSFLFITVIMLFTVSFEPSKNDWIQQSLVEVFTPMTRFFIASMFAYLISQYFDVWIYALLKKISKNRNVWLRNNISTLLSSLIDNIIFSILAWIVLNPEPETLYNVIMIYIFGTYLLRVIIAVLDTPILYLAKYFIQK